MIALITGGAGFIGSNLCRKLLSMNYEVICLDNFYSGLFSNIEILLNDPNFKFINHDVREPFDIECDIIFNLACPASPPFYQKDPIFTTDTCYLGTKNALNCAKKYNAKLLQASTSEIYGNPDVNHHPQSENYFGNVNIVGPRSCYDEGKRIAETLCMDYHKLYGLDVYIIRIFNTYGPFMRLDDGRVITNIISQILNNQDITIYGDGMQTRSFQYIDDLIEGILLLINTNYHFPVNLGNPEEFTIKELVDVVCKLIPNTCKIIYKNLPTDDPLQRKPDINKASKLLHWKPKINLQQGLMQLIHELQKNCNKERCFNSFNV